MEMKLGFLLTDTRPFRSSSHPARSYPLGLCPVETDRKRNLYILTEIGKQFVSSFEIDRAGKCAYVHQSVVISLKHLPFCRELQLPRPKELLEGRSSFVQFPESYGSS